MSVQAAGRQVFCAPRPADCVETKPDVQSDTHCWEESWDPCRDLDMTTGRACATALASATDVSGTASGFELPQPARSTSESAARGGDDRGKRMGAQG